MNKLLMVTPDKAHFNEFALVLAQNDDVEVSWAETGQRALDMWYPVCPSIWLSSMKNLAI